MLVQVTSQHIASANPLPSYSPVALALQELGYANASATHRYAYFDDKCYPLPEIAVQNEIKFDFLAKSGKVQGEVLEQILAFEFEL
jgi:hypothetical protein